MTTTAKRNGHGIDYAALAADLLPQAPDLLPRWFPAGKLVGREFCVGNLAGDPGDSLKVNIDTGRWADFAETESGGDLLDLYAKIHNVKAGEAARALMGPSRGNGASGKGSKRSGNGKAPTFYRTRDEAIAAACLWKSKEGGTLAGTFDYADAAALRFDLPTARGLKQRKDFVPVSRHPAGWRIGDPPGLWPLYHVADLAPDGRVWIFEGEAKTDAARGNGLNAVTSAHGSKAPGKTDWRPLAGRDVTIVPDNDGPGREFAQAVAAILAKLGARVRIVDLAKIWPAIPEAGDIGDFLGADGPRDGSEPQAIRAELEALADGSPLWAPSATEPEVAGILNTAGDVASAPMLVRLSDVRREPVRWLWPGRIARGKVSMVAGDPGLGKSTAVIDIGSRVSTGAGWPDRPGERFEPGGVVLITAEDDLADTVGPRLDAAGADSSRINALQTVRHTDPATGAAVLLPFSLSDMAALEKAIEQTADCRLVIVDPISAYLGTTDSHNNAEVRAVLAPLADLAARRGVSVLCVSHLNKAAGGSAVYRITGSLAFAAAARAVWAVTRDNADPTGKRRLFLPIKNNLATDHTGLAFGVRDTNGHPAIAWEAEPVSMSADNALAAPGTGKPGPEPEERDEAADFLRTALADGPRLARDMIEEAREAHGLSKSTLDRARRDVGVDAFRPANPGPWYWRLPGSTSPTTLSPPKPEYLDNLPINTHTQREAEGGAECPDTQDGAGRKRPDIVPVVEGGTA